MEINTLPKAFFESWTVVFGIWLRSGFLIPCIKLMWFFNMTLVVNVVLVSVQYLKCTQDGCKFQSFDKL